MNPKDLLNSLIELQKVLLSLHELDWFHTLGQNVNYGKVYRNQEPLTLGMFG